jgi:paraquat-inducible protein B
MSKQPNKKVIGIFVVGGIALVIVAVLILGSGKFFRQTAKAVCYFEGSVGGLNTGAPVVFKGVKIGSVTDVALRFNTQELSFAIPVHIEIEPSKIVAVGPLGRTGGSLKALVDKGLRAQLEMQSIVTGQLQVGLDLRPEKPAKLVGTNPKEIEIPTVPTPLQELAQKLQKLPIEEILEKIRSALDGITNVMASPEIPETVHSVNQTVKNVEKMVRNVNDQLVQVASNLNETVQDVRKLVQNADARVTGLASGLDATVKDVRGLVQNADARVTGLATSVDATVKDVRGLVQNANAQVTELGASVDAAVKDVRKLVQNADVKVTGMASNLDETVKETRGLIRNVNNGIEPILAGVQKSLESLNMTLAAARNTMEGIDSSMGDSTALFYQMEKALEGINGLSRSTRILTELLAQHPDSLIWGK